MTSPTPSPTRFNVTRSSPSLWRVTFHNPPINLIDPVMIVELHTLLTQIEQDNQVAVVVFDSADPDFFLAHYDIAADPSAFDALPAAPSAFHHWADFLIRLGKSSAVTITALRGRARGAGSEFALASDIRFASRERALDPSASDRRSRAGGRDPVRGRGLRRGARRAVWIRQPRRSRRGVRRVRRCLRGRSEE